jgi:hypothetical protein
MKEKMGSWKKSIKQKSNHWNNKINKPLVILRMHNQKSLKINPNTTKSIFLKRMYKRLKKDTSTESIHIKSTLKHHEPFYRTNQTS